MGKINNDAFIALCTSGGEDETIVAFDRYQTYSWAILKGRIAAWESFLIRQPGQYFAVSLSQVFEFTALLFAAIRCQKKLCLCPQLHYEGLEQIKRFVDGFIGEFDPSYCPIEIPPSLTIEDLFPPTVPIDPKAPLLILLTAGSTGQPKIIRKTLLQLLDEVAMLEKQWGWAQKDIKIISTVSHLHQYGFIFGCFWPLSVSRPFCTENIIFIEEVADYPIDQGILISSPTHLKRVLDYELPWQRLQENITMIFSSGAPLSEHTAQAIQTQLHLSITEIYGSSETGALAMRSRLMPGSYWQKLPGVMWRTISHTQQLQANAQHVAPTWINCDDLASLSVEGMTLLGRGDDVVKLEGVRISLLTINNALESIEMVCEAKCILTQDTIGAFIVLSETGIDTYRERGRKTLSRLLQQRLTGLVDPQAIPRRWCYLFTMPLNSQGKLKKIALQNVLQPDANQNMLIELEVVVTPLCVSLYVFVSSSLSSSEVLPEVAQIEWIVKYGQRYFDPQFSFKRVEASQFSRPIEEDTALKILLEYDSVKRQIIYTISSLLGEQATGRLVGED